VSATGDSDRTDVAALPVPQKIGREKAENIVHKKAPNAGIRG